MAEGVRSIIPSAYMGHIGVYYDLATDSVIEFMVTMPNRIHDRPVLVIDPFIDSGITACAAIDIILEYGVLPENIHFLTLIISKQGYNKLNANSSSAGVTFYATRIDGHSDDEIWFDDFDNMNERLYRTTNKPRRPQS